MGADRYDMAATTPPGQGGGAVNITPSRPRTSGSNDEQGSDGLARGVIRRDPTREVRGVDLRARTVTRPTSNDDNFSRRAEKPDAYRSEIDERAAHPEQRAAHLDERAAHPEQRRPVRPDPSKTERSGSTTVNVSDGRGTSSSGSSTSGTGEQQRPMVSASGERGSSAVGTSTSTASNEAQTGAVRPQGPTSPADTGEKRFRVS